MAILIDVKYEVDSNGCWNCTNHKPTSKGYIRIYRNGDRLMLHRFVYMEYIKTKHIPIKLLVCHRCDNRKCINPEHMFLGRHEDNQNDKVNKGRQSKGENHGTSVLDESDIILIRDWYSSKFKTQRELSQIFGVNQSTISRILTINNWKHL